MDMGYKRADFTQLLAVCLLMSREPEQMKPKGEGPVGSVISDPVLLDRYVTIADYIKQESNQCSLEAGQVVEVVEKNQHGGWVRPAWWVGGSSVVGGQEPAWGWGGDQCYHVASKCIDAMHVPPSNCVPHSLPPILFFCVELHHNCVVLRWLPSSAHLGLSY